MARFSAHCYTRCRETIICKLQGKSFFLSLLIEKLHKVTLWSITRSPASALTFSLALVRESLLINLHPTKPTCMSVPTEVWSKLKKSGLVHVYLSVPYGKTYTFQINWIHWQNHAIWHSIAVVHHLAQSAVLLICCFIMHCIHHVLMLFKSHQVALTQVLGSLSHTWLIVSFELLRDYILLL